MGSGVDQIPCEFPSCGMVWELLLFPSEPGGGVAVGGRGPEELHEGWGGPRPLLSARLFFS